MTTPSKNKSSYPQGFPSTSFLPFWAWRFWTWSPPIPMIFIQALPPPPPPPYIVDELSGDHCFMEIRWLFDDVVFLTTFSRRPWERHGVTIAAHRHTLSTYVVVLYDRRNNFLMKKMLDKIFMIFDEEKTTLFCSGRLTFEKRNNTKASWKNVLK